MTNQSQTLETLIYSSVTITTENLLGAFALGLTVSDVVADFVYNDVVEMYDRTDITDSIGFMCDAVDEEDYAAIKEYALNTIALIDDYDYMKSNED